MVTSNTVSSIDSCMMFIVCIKGSDEVLRSSVFGLTFYSHLLSVRY